MLIEASQGLVGGLCCAVPCCAVPYMPCTRLCWAGLGWAVLRCAALCCAVLCCAVLCCAVPSSSACVVLCHIVSCCACCGCVLMHMQLVNAVRLCTPAVQRHLSYPDTSLAHIFLTADTVCCSGRSIEVIPCCAEPADEYAVDASYMGAPTVSIEKLDSNQAQAAAKAVLKVDQLIAHSEPHNHFV